MSGQVPYRPTNQWTVDDLFHAVIRSWKVLVACLVAAVVAGGLAYVFFPQTYTASAQRTVEPITVMSTGSTFNTVSMQTERVVATSTSVLERASHALDGVPVSDLREATEVTVPQGSQVLTVSVTSGSPQQSADWANAVAKAYGDQRSANAATVVEQSSTALERSIADLQRRSTDEADGSPEQEAIELQLKSLLDERARLSATPYYSGTVVTPAVPPLESNRPGIAVFTGGAVFVGVLVGAVAACITSRVRDGRTETIGAATPAKAARAEATGTAPGRDRRAGVTP